MISEVPEASPQELRAFADALDAQMTGRTNTWLADQVGVTKQSVADWRTGTKEPQRRKVFALEHLFGLPPGALSCHLGYLPLEARSVLTVEEAIETDSLLSAGVRQALLAAVRSARQSTS